MDYYISVATFGALNVILALGLNLISGFCGQVSLGHAAFYGLGAYAAALCAVAGVPLAISLLAGTLVAGAFGALVGLAALRVRDDFLAIVTMGVGFLFLGAVRKQRWAGAEMGIANIPSPLDKWGYAVLAIGTAVGLVLLSAHIRRSWMGRAFAAVAQDEEAARAIGIDVAGYKITAFFLGTAAAGLAGGIYAHMAQLIVPDAFNFVESITILAMVVVGGLGSTGGVVAGALLLTLIPELFRFVNDYKLLVFGGLLLLLMRFSPGGIASLVRKVRRRVRA
jgi:branched-chain amino acid transport system permease protein